MTITNRVITPKAVKGWASHDSKLGTFAYDLDNLYSPDNAQSQSCVLDLASPKYNTNSAYIYDKSGKNNHGTITGATWVRLTSGLWVLDDDGTDDKITLQDTLEALIVTGFTCSAWVKPDNFDTAVSNIFCLGFNQDAKKGFRITIGNSASPLIQIGDGTTLTSLWFDHAITNTTYYMITCTWDGTTLKNYINGVQETTTTAFAGPIVWDLNRHTYLGFDPGVALYFDGRKSLHKILNRAWTATEGLYKYNYERVLLGV